MSFSELIFTLAFEADFVDGIADSVIGLVNVIDNVRAPRIRVRDKMDVQVCLMEVKDLLAELIYETPRTLRSKNTSPFCKDHWIASMQWGQQMFAFDRTLPMTLLREY